jgi:hypothetical protein
VFANVTLTIILALVSAALISDVAAFWHDRTFFGNAIMVAAVAFTVAWFFEGLRGVW